MNAHRPGAMSRGDMPPPGPALGTTLTPVGSRHPCTLLVPGGPRTRVLPRTQGWGASGAWLSPSHPRAGLCPLPRDPPGTRGRRQSSGPPGAAHSGGCHSTQPRRASGASWRGPCTPRAPSWGRSRAPAQPHVRRRPGGSWVLRSPRLPLVPTLGRAGISGSLQDTFCGSRPRREGCSGHTGLLRTAAGPESSKALI